MSRSQSSPWASDLVTSAYFHREYAAAACAKRFREAARGPSETCQGEQMSFDSETSAFEVGGRVAGRLGSATALHLVQETAFAVEPARIATPTVVGVVPTKILEAWASRTPAGGHNRCSYSCCGQLAAWSSAWSAADPLASCPELSAWHHFIAISLYSGPKTCKIGRAHV